ncbi:MAG: O-methyltransferase, partial [Candidatus Izemoplasmatales bacterium]|nr:O-methyltransferase [Candidatus Izemoplasmatales bacterium]
VQAKENKTPIVTDEAINMIIQTIIISRAKRVLEIGSAIGYSAILMALKTHADIVSIEKDVSSYNLAKENIKKASLDKRIKLILGDALEVELNDEFDLIFIDAAKAQYLKFLERFKTNLKTGGIIICDNLLFHGLVENPSELEQKRLKSLVKKIDSFNRSLIEHKEFDTYIYELGDGLSISIKK